MTPLEIILILIGIGIIIFSCFLVDKSEVKVNDSKEGHNDSSKIDLNPEEITDIKKKVDDIISNVTEETILKTEDQLSQISNEKIIAVSDFSNQVIEKISQNHDEVVFLYNMLNEKEDELKDIMKKVDNAKKQVLETDLVFTTNSIVNNLNHINQVAESNQNNQSLQINSINQKVQLNPMSQMNQLNQANQSNQIDEKNEDEVNNNDKILTLHEQGKSIIEIAKILELGQGEVKLVIDLFMSKK